MQTIRAFVGAFALTINAAVVHGQAAAAKPAAADSGFFQRGQLTGDWNGTRTKWKTKGIEVAGAVTQFYQGVASGGIRTGSEYNGVAELALDFDLEKLNHWKFWSMEAKAELRFGGPVLTGVGSISPVNTAALIPAPDGTVLAVTSLNVTRLIPVDLKKGNMFAVSIGRYNLLDLIEEGFFGGSGVERFWNLAQIGPLTVLREIPLITNSLSLAYIRGGEPIVILAVMDPNDHSVDAGLTDFFHDGATFAPTINFPAKYFGKSAKHTLGGAITTKEYTPFVPIRALFIPGPALRAVEPERGSWSASYTFRQSIVERAKDDGWGFFGQVSVANRSTSPVTTFFDLGVGGNGLFSKRAGDEFGIAYAYTDLSPRLKDNLDLRIFNGRLRVEHQVELFYNVHFAPWLQLTGDVQVIRPNRPIAETAFIPGVRLRVVF